MSNLCGHLSKNGHLFTMDQLFLNILQISVSHLQALHQAGIAKSRSRLAGKKFQKALTGRRDFLQTKGVINKQDADNLVTPGQWGTGVGPQLKGFR